GQGGLEAGLGAGVLAGRVAARCAKGRAKPLDYERRWKLTRLAGHAALRGATERLARLGDDEVDALLAPWSGRTIPIAQAWRALGNPRGVGALARAWWRARADR